MGVAIVVLVALIVPSNLAPQDASTLADENATTTKPNPVPLINQPLVPEAIRPGSLGFTLTVNGTGFVPGSVVKWSGSGRATKFVNSSRLTASILSTDVAKAGTAFVTVGNPSPGGGSSNVAFIEITRPTATVALDASAVRAAAGPASVVAGDFNGDGRLDLAVANVGSNNVSVLLGNGNGRFQPAVEYSVGSTPLSIAVGDFNRDGKLDLAVGNVNSHDVSILLGNGDGTFRAKTNYPTGNGCPSSVAVGDFNGDGKPDLAVSCGSVVSVLLGNGDGTFRAHLDSGVGGIFLAAGDFNRDGKLDLAVASESNVNILLGNGDGTFRAAQSYPTPDDSTSVAVGDFNGDGKLDLVVTNIVTNQGFGNVGVLLGKGDGTFLPAVNFGVGSNPSAVGVGDFNGDGKLDIAVANYGGYGNVPNVSLLLGEGDGTFQPAVDYATDSGPYGLYSLALGDFNGDGRLDMAVGDGASGASTISVLLQPPLVTGVDADLDPANLIFPIQLVGTTSTAQSILLVNYGTVTLRIAGIEASGDFAQTHTCGSSLAAGSSCTISVAFRPTQGETLAGTLSVSDNAPGSPQTVALRGTGTMVKLSPTQISFVCYPIPFPQYHCVCPFPQQTTTLTNVGNRPLDITGIAISDPFSQTHTCGSSVAAGNSCGITVTWSRTGGSGEISVIDNGGASPQTVPLTGRLFCSP